MRKTFLLFFSLSAAVLLSGCRKQVSTLMETPRDQVPGSVVSQPDPFEGIDTSDEASFRAADMAEELARQVRENLRTIYFDFNSFQLNDDAVQKLIIASKFLKDNSGIRILIQGHCDERGSSEYNMGLGEKRARAVKDYLLNFGVAPIRLEMTSLGKEQPVISFCNDESCHLQNRRAEFIVLAK